MSGEQPNLKSLIDRVAGAMSCPDETGSRPASLTKLSATCIGQAWSAGSVMTLAVAFAAIGGTGHAPGSAPWLAYAASALILMVLGCGPMYVWWALGRGEQGGGDSSDGDGEGGGGGWGGGGSPPKGSPNTNPEWWPEFERQFAGHVASHLDERTHITGAAARTPTRSPPVCSDTPDPVDHATRSGSCGFWSRSRRDLSPTEWCRSSARGSSVTEVVGVDRERRDET